MADSKQTLLCTYLSAVVLVGLMLNSTLGWWWADPIAALALAGVAVKEGREALRGGLLRPRRRCRCQAVRLRWRSRRRLFPLTRLDMARRAESEDTDGNGPDEDDDGAAGVLGSVS